MGSSILGPSSCNEQDGVRCFFHNAFSLSWQDGSSASVKSRIGRVLAKLSFYVQILKIMSQFIF
uniref:Uncharacterized protein n=1 Tax=Anguilla anguilla TaxID=7936 RepID=A0A0E9PK98_ANGAN